ncbi:30S ribosomal protein S1 [Cytobacillus gottheilii]|uniref:30S ribosomal protein S1 n=1 Tax=Cytobacillus gottheilii TaxID=859144 RepID=UPI0024945ADD|nr:30S ribosomal protein S1 [Cytobacillus gottheilii]
MVVKSWNTQESLDLLADKFRFQEIVEGVIRSSSFMKLPVVRESGKTEIVEEETLIIALPGGITGYCVLSEFREREFKSIARFIGTKQSFLITELNLENQVALLSEKRAAARLRDRFWDTLEDAEEEGTLQEMLLEAVVSGYNQEKRIVHVRIDGQDAYMFGNDWSWRERDVIDAQTGETIEVKIVRFDKENQLVQVSRKDALPDPKDYLLTLKRDQLIAGRVSGVSKLHGLFVDVENSVTLKAGKVRSLEEPEVGDIVTCRVRSVDPENRRGKVIIIEYPRGKRKRKDLGSFLFE